MISSLSITSPNTDRSLLTLTSARSAAGVEDNSKDVELQALIRFVSATITKACKVAVQDGIPPTLRLETVAQTVELDAYQEKIILLRHPVISIASVIEDGATLTVSADYRLTGSLLLRRSGGSKSHWPSGVDIVTTYAAGFETVPDDLEFAARKFVTEEWQSGSRDRLLKSKTVEGVDSHEWWVDPTKDQVIPADVMTILKDGGYVNTWFS